MWCSKDQQKQFPTNNNFNAKLPSGEIPYAAQVDMNYIRAQVFVLDEDFLQAYSCKGKAPSYMGVIVGYVMGALDLIAIVVVVVVVVLVLRRRIKE